LSVRRALERAGLFEACQQLACTKNQCIRLMDRRVTVKAYETTLFTHEAAQRSAGMLVDGMAEDSLEHMLRRFSGVAAQGWLMPILHLEDGNTAVLCHPCC